MATSMMLESALDSFHFLPQHDSNVMGDDDEDNPSLPPSSLQRSKSYYDHHAILNPLPRLLYSPPANFGMVTHNLYRSSFPQKENFAYIRRLGLKSVLYCPRSCCAFLFLNILADALV